MFSLTTSLLLFLSNSFSSSTEVWGEGAWGVVGLESIGEEPLLGLGEEVLFDEEESDRLLPVMSSSSSSSSVDTSSRPASSSG